ncbi:hypothetical protein EV688_101159 [Chromatocurvus halotolerans]|uniref:Uncharacterized protein n=1 Tax=Chromatocurvus halotolerans TaxID=1132028 RepID=A0A4R2KWS2_9GAMM|nr:hypothetical protein EV688_101159 [Chromatocurvus halotolerans]
MVCACCAALLHSASIASSDTTLPVILREESPNVLALVDTAAELLANSETPIILVLTTSPNAYPDTRNVPFRASLLTPTRFVLERLSSGDSPPGSRVILGRLNLPGDGAAPLDDSVTLAALTEGRLPPAIIRPETLLLTTAGWRLTDSQPIYRQLLAALDQAVIIQNTARERPANAPPPTSGNSSDVVEQPLYRLSLDWSLITSLQVRLAWVREVHPALADRDVNILSWIASGPLAEVSPSSVDPILLGAGDDAR